MNREIANLPESPIQDSSRVAYNAHVLRPLVCHRCPHKSSLADVCDVVSREKRRYCEYPGGPVGWSYSREDTHTPKLAEKFEFTGCREDVLNSASLPWIVFVLRHELEHDRQRWCAESIRDGMWNLFACEFEANRAAWISVRQLAFHDRPLRRALAYVVAPLDSVMLSFLATFVSTIGAWKSQALLWGLPVGVAIGARLLPGPLDPAAVFWVLLCVLGALATIMTNELLALWLRRSR